MSKVQELVGYVQRWNKNGDEHPAWGLRLAESHGKGDERTYTNYTVKVSRASGIDLRQFKKDDRLRISGTQQTESREYDGKRYDNLVIWAETVEIANSTPAQTPDNWVEVDDPDAPF